MNTVRSKAQEKKENREKTALMTQTMRSAADKIILQTDLMPVLLKKENKKRRNNKLEIRRSLRLNLVHCTIRKWPWMIEFS